MNPKYPVFIPSKGRADSRLTMRALDRINVPFTVVVEPQEFDSYAAVIGEKRLLVTPHQNQGLVVTRNFIWDHALSLGTRWFWTFDDNIQAIYRRNKNLTVKVGDGAVFCAAEHFVARYVNLPIAGFQYDMFVPRREPRPPIAVNRRVYSNMLIETDFRDPRGKPYRNEGFYNDDTDLCLRVLKDGNCTVLFNAFLIKKVTTMTVAGGMTPHYQGDGRWKMADELRRKHPDVTTITRKFGRWQHQVDYRPFKNNRLVRRRGVEIPEGTNEFGMTLETIANG